MLDRYLNERYTAGEMSEEEDTMVEDQKETLNPEGPFEQMVSLKDATSMAEPKDFSSAA